MKTTLINNFCGASPLEVNANVNGSCGPLVTVKQNIGSCHFQHSMKPDQARALAAALIEGADELDSIATAARELAAEFEVTT